MKEKTPALWQSQASAYLGILHQILVVNRGHRDSSIHHRGMPLRGRGHLNALEWRNFLSSPHWGTVSNPSPTPETKEAGIFSLDDSSVQMGAAVARWKLGVRSEPGARRWKGSVLPPLHRTNPPTMGLRLLKDKASCFPPSVSCTSHWNGTAGNQGLIYLKEVRNNYQRWAIFFIRLISRIFG